jgi:hypothetical protein
MQLNDADEMMRRDNVMQMGSKRVRQRVLFNQIVGDRCISAVIEINNDVIGEMIKSK